VAVSPVCQTAKELVRRRICLINKVFSLAKELFADALRFARSPVKGLKQFHGVSLFRNATYLMFNNVFTQATGFFFWMAAARLYSTELVGESSASITAATLLSSLSLMGLDYALVRFLPTAGDKSRDMLNTSITIGTIMSVGIALIFIAGLGIWSPALLLIRQHPLFLVIFLLVVVATTLNTFAQRIFVARREAGLAMTRGIIFGLLRFIPLLILAFYFQSFGIFTSWGIALAVAVLISAFPLSKIEGGYYPQPVIKKDVLRSMVGFSFNNYIATILFSLPGLLLPIMVVNLIGAEQNAYFYIGWSLGNILLVIPTSLSFSLLAESSNNQTMLMQEVKRSLKLITLILVPSVIIMLLLGDKLLLLFGQAYSENAANLLRILALSTIPNAVISIYFSVQRVKLKMAMVNILSLLLAVLTLGLSWVLIPGMGIAGAGLGWLAGQTVIAVGIVISLMIKRKPKTGLLPQN
jgi:O-antigen/teichoic acid export membrane protein